MLIIFCVFREYGSAVAEITAAHNMFLDCKEAAENSNVKSFAKEMLSEAELLHIKYTKFNVKYHVDGCCNVFIFL